MAMMLRGLLYLKIAFSIGSDSFSAKWLTSSHSGIYRFLTVFKEKVFKSCAFLSSCVKILSFSTGVILSEDFVLSEKNVSIVFQDCYLQHLSRLKLVLTC